MDPQPVSDEKTQGRLKTYLAFLATTHRMAKAMASACMIGLVASIANVAGLILTDKGSAMHGVMNSVFNYVAPAIPFVMGGFVAGIAWEWGTEFLLKRNLKKLAPEAP